MATPAGPSNALIDQLLAKLAAAGTSNLSVHGPYEDALIEGFKIVGKLIDGQSPEQRVKIWQGWIDFWDGKWLK